MPNTVKQIHTLACDGVGLTVELPEGDRLPKIVHWGADPGGVLTGGFGSSGLALLPMQHEGWAGRPALSGDRAGRWPHLRLRLSEAVSFVDNVMIVRAADAEAGVAVESTIELTPHGVIRIRHSVTNTGADVWALAGLRCLLPVPPEAIDLLELTGRWALERVPQRGRFDFGTHLRENRRGRTGHDSTTLLLLGTSGFAHRTGEVWAVHVGWSGNHEHSAERLPDSPGAFGGGEVLEPGEIRLAPGETYQTPQVYFVHSSSGLDGVRDRFHRHLRARDNHPRSPRPVVLNTWEAVYFDHDLGKLKALADKAAQVGVEWFVLDDGWFRIKLYKSSRELLHTGRVVVPDIADASAVVHGVVAADSSRALFSYAQLASSPSSIPLRLRLPGLGADRRYRVGVALRPNGKFTTPDSFGGDWTGRALSTVGLALPRLNPADALVLELRSTGG